MTAPSDEKAGEATPRRYFQTFNKANFNTTRAASEPAILRNLPDLLDNLGDWGSLGDAARSVVAKAGRSMNNRLDFDAINRAALPAISSILARVLPGGKRIAGEYVVRNPRRRDMKPGSFKVNLRTGRWADFATGDKGGDPVSLVAYLAGVSQGEAARLLAQMLGLKSEGADGQIRAPLTERKNGDSERSGPRTRWVRDRLSDSRRAPKCRGLTRPWRCNGAPDLSRCGRRAAVLHLALRSARRAQAIHSSHAPRDAGGLRSFWKAAPAPRPLYGLEARRAPRRPGYRLRGREGCGCSGEGLP